MSTDRPKDEKNEAGKRWSDERTLTTSATPEQLWDAWGDPSVLKGWFADDARGSATPGDEIVHVWQAFGMEMRHKVLAAERPHRLVLEAHSPQGVPFRQEVLIEKEGGRTVLRLVHSGFGDDADWGGEYDGIDSGWKMAFALLQLFLESYFGRPRRTFTLIRPAAFEFADVYRLYTTDSGLGRWLGEARGMGEVGSELELAVAGEEPVTPKVLAATGTEVLLSWPPVEGALELKAFPMGPDARALCLRGHSWSGDPSAVKGLERLAQVALDRLMAAL